MKYRIFDCKSKIYLPLSSPDRVEASIDGDGNLTTTDKDRYRIEMEACHGLYEGDIIDIIYHSLYHSRQDLGFRGVIQYDVCNCAFVAIDIDAKMASISGQEVEVKVIANVNLNPEKLTRITNEERKAYDRRRID